MRSKGREHIVQMAVLSLITVAYLFADDRKGFYDENIYSVADSWISMMEPIPYTILVLPLLLITTAYGMRNDFWSNRILRYKSKGEILNEQCKKAFMSSVQTAGIYLMIISLFGFVKGREFCNWNQTNSYFFMKNRCVFQGNVIEIILVVFFLCLIRNVFISMMIVLSKWYFKNIVSGFFLPLGICIIEITQDSLGGLENIYIFLRRFIADYSFWISLRMRGEIVAYVLGYGVLLFLMAENILKKKEFFHGKKF